MPTLAPRRQTRSTATASSRRLKILAAVLGAVLLHAAVLLLLAWVLPHWPRPPIRKGMQPVVLTVLPPAAPTPEPAGPSDAGVPKQPEYMRTTETQKSDTPPPDPKFISDKDTLAAAEKPPTDSSKPLPTQEGREIPAFDFDTTPYRAGKEASDAASAAAAASEQAPPPPTPSKDKTPDRKKPKPDSKAQPTPRANTATPTPTPQGELASLKSDPTPSDQPPEPQETPPPDAVPTPPPPPQNRTPSRQPPSPAQPNSAVTSKGAVRAPGYQQQTIQTRMNGSVDNRGRSAVAALGTPLGRYEKAVSDAVGARWYFAVDQNMSSLIHTENVKIHFFVSRQGRIVNARIAAGNHQNSAFADISLQAVTEAELPPIPPDVAALLPGGELEVDYTFNLFD